MPRGAFLLLMPFVVAFGFVKGMLNFLTGRLTEWFSLGRSTTSEEIEAVIKGLIPLLIE